MPAAKETNNVIYKDGYQDCQADIAKVNYFKG